MREPSSKAAPLPIPEFSRWACAPRTAHTFDVTGGVIELKRYDVHRIKLAGFPDTPGTREPRRLFLAAITGYFQVPSFAKSAGAFVRNLKEARYVARMSAYLAGDVVEVPIKTSGLWEANLAEMKLLPNTPMSVGYEQLRSWYVMSMRSGRVVLPEDYELLQNDRSLRAARGPKSLSDWKNCLRVDFTVFQSLPQLIAISVRCRPNWH